MRKFVSIAATTKSTSIFLVHAEKLRNLGMVLVLAILASFAVAIPSATAATVSTVFPESGPNIGGTSVTVTGSGFGTTGTPTVTVGGTAATSVARQSDTQITFVTPAGEGVSDIVITPSVGEPVTVTGGFTYDSYLITPVIETINTPTVGQTGGEVITITGRYLNYVTSLTVGDSNHISWEYFQTRDSADGKYISFVSPYQSTPGPKDIKFYGGDQTVTEFAGVTYLAPEITKITPNTGPTGGTTAVVIDGVGFSSLGTLTVTAGGVAATAVTRVSPTQIKATFPANTAGLKDVVVTLYNAGSAPSVYPITKTGGFLYIEASSAPTLTAVLPADFQETVGGGTPGAVSIVLSTPQLEQDLAGAGNSELILNQIVLQSTGDPVPYAEARLRWSGSDGELETEDDVIFPVLADENGEFTVEGLVSGEYDVITFDDDPLMVDPKVVLLDAFSSIDGEVWELVERDGDDDGGALAETGTDALNVFNIGANLILLGALGGLVSAWTRRRKTL